jgi:uncharacterized protein (DUF2147 family)
MPVLTRAAAMLLTAAALSTSSAHAASANGPLGVWLDHTGRGAVEIKPCGDKLCGHVVWVKSTTDSKGCGRQIIGDAVAAVGKASLHRGWIYSPEARKRYNVDLSPVGDGRLKVLGYAGTRLFSKTMYWTPAAPDLQRCDTGGTTAAAPADKPAAGAAPAQAPKPAQPQTAAASEPKPNPAAAAPLVKAAPPAAAQALPATPQPESGPAVTENETGADARDDSAPDETAAADADGDGPRRLANILDKVLTRSASGDCKLDLPWVKVKFRCEDN